MDKLYGLRFIGKRGVYILRNDAVRRGFLAQELTKGAALEDGASLRFKVILINYLECDFVPIHGNADWTKSNPRLPLHPRGGGSANRDGEAKRSAQPCLGSIGTGNPRQPYCAY